ncbi:MAG: hypothetical protein DRN40_04975 [Thermoplasmata archaeon]|nr:MAG: hypothetical protein DRN40_04975 [Thermoplasmata archaeon]
MREVSGEAQSLGLLFFVYVGDIEAMDRVFQEGEWFRTLVLWRNGSFLHYLKTSLRPLGKSWEMSHGPGHSGALSLRFEFSSLLRFEFFLVKFEFFGGIQTSTMYKPRGGSRDPGVGEVAEESRVGYREGISPQILTL